MHDQNHIK